MESIRDKIEFDARAERKQNSSNFNVPFRMPLLYS